MLVLRRNDRLPTVAVLQHYLNHHSYSDQFVEVDGIYGPLTQRAVRDFQRGRGMNTCGVAGSNEWNQIVGNQWQVIESVDLTEPSDRRCYQDLVSAPPPGRTVVSNFGMSRGAPEVIRAIGQQGNPGKVVLLRMHGHGSPGNMVVSSGLMGGSGSSLWHRYGASFSAALQRHWGAMFCRFGSVELHGCGVGAGRAGHELLQMMANAVRVPVTAGIRSQLGGGATTYEFEGRTRTRCPGGVSLKTWAMTNCQTSMASV